MREKGILIVVSGFSGSGKGTIMKELLKQYDNYALSISATTRNPRPGEEDGREYFFKTVEDFEKMIAKEELIEYARYVDNYYGTPRAYVEEQLEAGKDVILGGPWNRDNGRDRIPHEPCERRSTGDGSI